MYSGSEYFKKILRRLPSCCRDYLCLLHSGLAVSTQLPNLRNHVSKTSQEQAGIKQARAGVLTSINPWVACGITSAQIGIAGCAPVVRSQKQPLERVDSRPYNDLSKSNARLSGRRYHAAWLITRMPNFGKPVLRSLRSSLCFVPRC